MGTTNPNAIWEGLVYALKHIGFTPYDLRVIQGFIYELSQIDNCLCAKFLDACLKDPLLRTDIVQLHRFDDFSEADFDRCVNALDNLDIDPTMHGIFLRRSEFDHLPKEKILHLSNRLLKHPKGKNPLIEALGMKLHRTDETVDTLGPEFRKIGLKAIIETIKEDNEGKVRQVGYHMAKVIRASLIHAGNDELKSLLLDTMFSGVDKSRYYLVSEQLFHQVADIMLEVLLDRIFSGDEEQQNRRYWIIEQYIGSEPGTGRDAVLATADIGRITQWCLKKNEPSVWEVIAKSLPAFALKGKDKSVEVSDASVQFLEASPYPKNVLGGYYFQIFPNFWSGNRSDVMARNAEAFKSFTEHDNQEISKVAKNLYRNAQSKIEEQLKSEQLEDESRDQRFE
jgi:hypothetical protein